MVEKDRMIFESVPGKQVTLAHIISNPDPKLFEKLGLDKENPNALGIMTITPSDVAAIAVDFARKEAEVEIAFVDRFSGSVCIYGDVSSVEMCINRVLYELERLMKFSVCRVTRT